MSIEQTATRVVVGERYVRSSWRGGIDILVFPIPDSLHHSLGERRN